MSSAHHPPQRAGQGGPRPVVEASGANPDEAMATLPGIYGGKHWHSTPTDGTYSYRYTAVGDEALTLRRSQLHGFLRGEVHIGGDYVVYWLTRGSVVLDVLGHPVPVPLMQPRLSPEGAEFVFEAADFDTRLVHLDRELVLDVASEQAGAHVRSLQLDARTPPEPAALARWRDTMAAVTATIASAETEPLAWHRATRAAAAAFLGLYPPQDDPPNPVLLSPRNARIRAATEFIHAHLGEPVTVAQIADAAGLSVRSTQEGFRRVLDMTPMRYLEQVRMEHVRADLERAEPGTTEVATVARRWGFFHVGRFSGAYRQRFGEYPSATLRHPL
jgi:AraC-like DNA-binding protein